VTLFWRFSNPIVRYFIFQNNLFESYVGFELSGRIERKCLLQHFAPQAPRHKIRLKKAHVTLCYTLLECHVYFERPLNKKNLLETMIICSFFKFFKARIIVHLNEKT